jgi:ADP-ribose pyrophosphatase
MTDTPPNHRRTVYDGHVVRLVIENDRWEIVEHAPAVVVLALRPGERGTEMLLVRQYRYGASQYTVEAPAGLIDPGESSEQAALRELSEECNLTGDLRLISQFYTSPGFCDEYIYLFEAKNLLPKPGTPDQDEHLEVLWMNVQDLLQAIRNAELFTSGPTMVAALHAANSQ